MSSRKPKKGQSFGDLHPEIAKEWHPTKNGDLNPFDFTKSSGRKVWWKCHKGDDHEWETSIDNRGKGKNCPICSGQKTVLSNCLATTHPELAKEWHPTKNGDLTPYDLMAGSGLKAWWKCPKGPDHEWETRLVSRKKGGKCPICSGQKTVLSNCLATLRPDIAVQWHPTKNGKLTPFDVTRRSNKNIWWKCTKGNDHEWLSRPNKRNKTKCPFCKTKFVSTLNSFATLYPKLSKDWHPTKNGILEPYDFSKKSNKRIWWKCDKGDNHEWIDKISSRVKGSSCPKCHAREVLMSKCLATTHPDLAKDWHPTKNGDLTPYDVIGGKDEKVWWKCDKGDDHVWNAIIYSRKKGSGCPVCAGRQVGKSNCLAIKGKKIAKEWHPTKNGDLTPNDVTIGSYKKVWWQCLKNKSHEWKTQINWRVNDDLGCPYCSNQKTNDSNSLATLYPDLVKEWHPTKNGIVSPKKVNPGSHKKVWWQCLRNPTHEWKTQISLRAKLDRNCPFCKLTPQSRQELILTFELITIFKKINPRGFKNIH